MTAKAALILASALLVAASVAGAETAPGDTLRIPCRLSRLEAHIGDRIGVRLAVPKPSPDARLVGPPPRAFGPVEVLASQPAAAGGDSTAWEMEIALFDLGEQSLGTLPLHLEDHERTVPARLDDCRIHIEPTLPDTATRAGLRDVKSPIEVPLRWRWGRVALALGILAALAALVVWWRRRPAPIVPVLPAPEIPPEEEALRALRELEDAALPGRGRVGEHYLRLSSIARHYVERRFRIPAVESTTSELRRSMGMTLRPPREPETLLDLLEESDLVKFARFDPGAETARIALSRTRAWVEANRPSEFAPPAETAHAAR